ncbi:hypothetical protein [Francisella sp. SYW-2]|uniref:hypothetical protein n=1 Tax=Francisella sp. SYW-2 TaxID=2610886 RepID=UPI00123CD700|nr:hypothetical protein [Francisella sp. SYW-2]
MKYAKKIILVILSTFILLSVAFSTCEMVMVTGTANGSWHDAGGRSRLDITVTSCVNPEDFDYCDSMPENITLNVPIHSFTTSAEYNVTGSSVVACGLPTGTNFDIFHFLHSAVSHNGEVLDGYVNINDTRITT